MQGAWESAPAICIVPEISPFGERGQAGFVLVSFPGRKKEAGKVTGREFELAYFDRLAYETCTREEREELIGAEGWKGKLRRKCFPFTVHWFHENKMYHPEIFSFENMYLSGYFACEKYYADILYDLREKIQFPISKNPLNREMAKEMQECDSVSMHIRRGII